MFLKEKNSNKNVLFKYYLQKYATLILLYACTEILNHFRPLIKTIKNKILYNY